MSMYVKYCPEVEKKKFQKNLTHFPLNGVRKKTLYETWIFPSRHLPVTHHARVRDCTLRIITGVVTPNFRFTYGADRA